MRIQTGHGTIPLITLIGIWSISALNALPGLAVSPILGKLSAIFPHSTELDIQMLSSLPSLLIIPFILLAGKLTERVNFIRLLQAGLAIFALSGVLYLLSGQMWQLIAVSALLGVGSGLIESWLAHGKKETPEEMARLISKLISTGMKSVYPIPCGQSDDL